MALASDVPFTSTGRIFWTMDRVAQALASCSDQPLPGGAREFASISTDTRMIAAGTLFVALKGENFDAHDFLEEAVAAGASALVVSSAMKETAQFPSKTRTWNARSKRCFGTNSYGTSSVRSGRENERRSHSPTSMAIPIAKSPASSVNLRAQSRVVSASAFGISPTSSTKLAWGPSDES